MVEPLELSKKTRDEAELCLARVRPAEEMAEAAYEDLWSAPRWVGDFRRDLCEASIKCLTLYRRELERGRRALLGRSSLEGTGDLVGDARDRVAQVERREAGLAGD